MKSRQLACAIALVLVSGHAVAITEQDGNASIQFGFSNPGARSLGMGGAFIGRADDASAAYTNPAGLTQLSQNEVSAEFRRYEYETEFLSTGTYDPPYDTDDLVYGRSESSETSPSFLSFVAPFENWAIAAYRHEYIDYSTSFESPVGGGDGGAIVSFPNGDVLQFEPFRASTRLEGVSYGVSVAFDVGDNLSLGANIARSELDFDSRAERFNDDRILNRSRQGGDDDDITFGAGLLWKVTDSFRLGASYRGGGEYGYGLTCETVDVSVPNSPLQACAGFPKSDVSFDVPSMFGIGAAWQVTDALGFTLDVIHISYSDITDGIRSAFIADDNALQDEFINELQIDDGTEIRLGAEYVFTNFTTPFAVRAGIWRDPAHTIAFQGEPNPDSQLNTLYSALFSRSEDVTHYSLGIGWAFEKFQIDAALDVSDIADTLSVSGVVRF